MAKHCTQDEQLEIHILDFMLRRGYYDTADLYCKQIPWLASFNDAIIFKQISQICEEIE
jgi:hypothetical protein